MGMCKSCGIVFSALDMKNGYCQDCISSGKVNESELKEQKIPVNFDWWIIYGWLNLSLGNAVLYFQLALMNKEVETAIFLIIINSILMIYVLKFNKYAFLIATILSLNPIFWIINGIYLKNRWHHSKINKQ